MTPLLPTDLASLVRHHRDHHRIIHQAINDAARPLYAQQLVWTKGGDLSVVTGLGIPVRVRNDGTIPPFNFQVTVAPLGAALKFDILNNGVSIFAAPPQIAIGTDYVQAAPVAPDASAGDILTFNILQVGSSTPGAHLYVESLVEPAA